ncbi:MAG: hypothetical protein WDO73_01325 [Ignavibacteriota bacterium]
MIGLTNSNAQVKAAVEAVRLAQENLDGEQKKLAAGWLLPMTSCWPSATG